jgi:cellulose biosynthesis protein BcsQ
VTARVITFYSFKGGVGRTQALANVAVGLANRGRNVIAVDMDLESPGLHSFFYPEDRRAAFQDADFADKAGLLDFVEDCLRLPADEPEIRDRLVPCTHHNHKPGMGSIRLLTAGRLAEDYPARVGAFSWERFYSDAEGYRFIELLRDRLVSAGADYVLIDSRTGMTDVANICTFQLPDVVVVLFALHEQGIEGARRVAQAIKRAQPEEMTGTRPREVLLLPSRVEEGGNLVSRDEWLLKVHSRLSGLGRLIAEQEYRLPYAAEHACGETVVVDAPTQSKLSLAYGRLIEILEPTAGAGRTQSVSPPKRPSFRALQANLERLTKNVHALMARLEATALVHVPFVHLQGLAQEIVQQRNGFLEEVRKVRGALQALALESDTEVLGTPEVEVDSAETPDGWRAILESLRGAALSQMERWVASQRRRIEVDLLGVAEQDAALVEPAIRALLPWIERGDLDEVEARLPTLRDDIARNGLEALLQANRLDMARLERSRPDPAARRVWVDDRLQKVLTAGSLDQSVAPVLENLLRLRAEMRDRPEPLHFSAYDVLCGRVADDAGEVGRMFEEIGHWLWRGLWAEVFRGTTGAEGLPSIPGPDARRQMESVLRSRPELAMPLVTQVTRDILVLWRDGKRRLVQEIIARRREDAVLRAALIDLGKMPDVPSRARRELLAPWLRSGDMVAADGSIVKSYTEALVEEGYDAEAFYVLEALRALGSSVGADTGPVELAFLLRAVERSREDVLQVVLADAEIRERVAMLRPGRALFVLLAWQPDRLPERARSHSHVLRQTLTETATSAPPLPPDLAALVHQPIDFALETITRTRSLAERVRHEYQSNRFRGNWVASAHYERDFHALVEAELAALLGSREPRAIEIARQESAWDAEKWIVDALAEQKRRGLRTSEPDGDARKAIVRTFSEVRERFLELARLRHPSGTPPLAEMLERAPRILDAMHELRAWTLSSRPEDGAETHLAQRVARLLTPTEDAEDEEV